MRLVPIPAPHTAQRALQQLGVPASLEHTDIGSARGQRVDIVIGQSTYLSEVGDIAPVNVPITSFVDVNHVRERLEKALIEKGWL
jgi:PTS system ascorbate-specific IIC component